MTIPTITTDICVIGGGSGGLSVAAGAAQMGARVVLIEPGPMGGDCLNFGCVPSKALITAAKAAYQMRHSQHLGVKASGVEIDMTAVAAYVQSVIDTIAPHDSVERFNSLGVTVIQKKGQFIAPDRVQAEDQVITARYFVVATGSTAFIPPLPGLGRVPYLTNHTIFQQKTAIDHLLVLGGGPIGLELAQSHRRLGAKVSVIEMMRCMVKDDEDCALVVLDQLKKEGVELYEGHKAIAVENSGEGIKLRVAPTEDESREKVLEGSHLLVATGRRAVIDGLGLEAAGIEYTPRGITVDSSLRTNNRRVFAIGDVIGGYQFTHTAGYHAGVIIRQMLFRLPAKAAYHAMPWVTYTDPELAHVGESEQEAARRLGEDQIRVISWSFEENDRAQAEALTQGKIKIVTDRRGRVLGTDIVGHHAGELILPWQKMVAERQKVGRMAGAIAAYPTRSEISKRVAGQYFIPTLYSERMRKIVRFLLRLP